MAAHRRWLIVTALAPVAWASTYFVTREYLPQDQPLYGAFIRAMPAGLLLIALSRRRPRGSWWWKSVILGTLNMGAFFALVYVAAQELPTSTATTIMATSPMVVMLAAWLLIQERPSWSKVLGAVVGVLGVAVMVLNTVSPVSVLGLTTSAAAMLMSSCGYVLAKRWIGEVDILSSTAWQLIAGGLTLLLPAVVIEGAPRPMSTSSAVAFGYVSVIATALAFVCWFAGLRRLPAATVGLIGLLNPVTGTLLGAALASEVITPRQGLGVGLTLGGVLLGQRGSRIPALKQDRSTRRVGDRSLLKVAAHLTTGVRRAGDRVRS
jgi:probable blue pigment (indigoidine) exporter